MKNEEENFLSLADVDITSSCKTNVQNHLIKLAQDLFPAAHQEWQQKEKYGFLSGSSGTYVELQVLTGHVFWLANFLSFAINEKSQKYLCVVITGGGGLSLNSSLFVEFFGFLRNQRFSAELAFIH
jgi:hypothetical protein